jgi:thymidylate kinase
MKEQSTLNLVYKLCQALKAKGVAYCHWKSNAALDRSARGDNDLDLLVDRADVQRFTEILYQLGFKEATAPSRQQMPGVLDYYGYDKGADKLVHVHAYCQLILGHDATKNHRLPIERPFLESSVQGDLFKVPAPEFELIVFVIRMALKYSTWDAILGRQGTLSIAERQELEYLEARASQTRIYDTLNQHVPYVDATLFDSCLHSLEPGFSMWARVKVGQRLQNRLRAQARRSQLADVSLKLWRRVVWPIRSRVFRCLPKKRIADGGLMIAIVGGDGAGKSTAVDELHAWLSQDFEAIKMHMGKPSWSWTTIVVRGILKIGRSLGLYPFLRAPVQYKVDANSVVFPGYPWLLREVCTARDRYLTYVKARRFATNGGLVICDRFPLPQVKFMDGPQAERMTGTCKNNRLIAFLIHLERKYYQPIMLPELLIVLRINPETAVQRKTDEDAASVRARSTEIWELDWQETPAHIIDADRSRAEVLSELKALVWSQL